MFHLNAKHRQCDVPLGREISSERTSARTELGWYHASSDNRSQTINQCCRDPTGMETNVTGLNAQMEKLSNSSRNLALFDFHGASTTTTCEGCLLRFYLYRLCSIINWWLAIKLNNIHFHKAESIFCQLTDVQAGMKWWWKQILCGEIPCEVTAATKGRADLVTTVSGISFASRPWKQVRSTWVFDTMCYRMVTIHNWSQFWGNLTYFAAGFRSSSILHNGDWYTIAAC